MSTTPIDPVEILTPDQIAEYRKRFEHLNNLYGRSEAINLAPKLGPELKRGLIEHAKPLLDFIQENNLAGAWIPIQDQANEDIQVEIFPLPPEITSVLSTFGSIYIRVNEHDRNGERVCRSHEALRRDLEQAQISARDSQRLLNEINSQCAALERERDDGIVPGKVREEPSDAPKSRAYQEYERELAAGYCTAASYEEWLEQAYEGQRVYMDTIRLNIPAEFTKQPQLDLCMQRMKERIQSDEALRDAVRAYFGSDQYKEEHEARLREIVGSERPDFFTRNTEALHAINLSLEAGAGYDPGSLVQVVKGLLEGKG